MEVRRGVHWRALTIASLLVAAISLLLLAHIIASYVELQRTLRALRDELAEVEERRAELESELRGLERLLRAYTNASSPNVWHPNVNGSVRGVVYLLPSKASSPYWREKYGDRIMFYAYANLSLYEEYIEMDFRLISKVYNLVILVVPLSSSSLYFRNLRLVNEIANRSNLKLMWVLLLKRECKDGEECLAPGFKAGKMVLAVMEYLTSLKCTWRVSVQIEGAEARDILEFYSSLPENLRSICAVWISEHLVEEMVELCKNLDPDILVVTELYSKHCISRYSNIFEKQMVVTGYQGAREPVEWLREIAEKLSLIEGRGRLLAIRAFYDINDGHGERYACYFPGRPLPDPFSLTLRVDP